MPEDPIVILIASVVFLLIVVLIGYIAPWRAKWMDQNDARH